MRTLLLFVLGFAASCGVYCYVPAAAAGFLLIAACAAAAAIPRFRVRKQAAVTAVGVLLGLLFTVFYDARYLQIPNSMDAVTADVTVTMTDYGRRTDYGTAANGKVTLSGREYRVRLYLESGVSLQPGDTVSGLFRFQSTVGSGKTYLRGQGVFLTANAAGDVCVSRGSPGRLRYLPVRLRQWLMERIDGTFPEDTAAFAKALLLGEDDALSYETNTALKLSGIRHVVAVSGLHIAVLMSVIRFLTGKRRWLTALAGMPALLLFSAVAGFTPSILRACVMQMLFLLADCCNREYDPPTALSAAVLLMLLFNPMVVTSMSFQLSVGSVAGIFLFTERIQKRILVRFGVKGNGLKAKLVRWLAASVSVSLGATSLITPLLALYTGEVSLVSILANILTIYFVSFIFVGIAAVCAVGAVWQTGAAALAWAVSLLIRYVLGVAKIMAAFPLAAVYTKSPYIAAWLAVTYGLLGIFLIRGRRHAGRYALVVTAALCAALLLSWVQPLTEHYRMTVLDVGQGQCVLLQSEGKTYMVDCGGENQTATADLAADTLLAQGITRLDGLILTHYDLDHVGAAGYLLTRIPADTLFLPAAVDDKGICESLPKERYDTAVTVRQNLCLTFGKECITIFASDHLKSDNESSLCVLFQRENYDILITGDRTAAGELALLQNGLPRNLDVLVAGHHGAETSTGTPLLAATTPETVVISVGEGNRFGHPSQAVLDRLETFGCTVYRTDIDGTIIIKGVRPWQRRRNQTMPCKC